MSNGKYQHPGPYLGTDTDRLCKNLERQHFARNPPHHTMIKKHGPVPVESFNVWRDPADDSACFLNCWDLRQKLQDENRAVYDLKMVCPENAKCIPYDAKVRREFRPHLRKDRVTRKGRCAEPKKVVKAVVKASARECVDLTLSEPSDVIAATIDPDPELERPAQRPRLEIDLNIPATAEPDSHLKGEHSIRRPQFNIHHDLPALQTTTSDQPRTLRIFASQLMMLTDLDSRRTETSIDSGSLAWSDVTAGHVYRTCITTKSQTSLHVSAMSTCRSDGRGSTSC